MFTMNALIIRSTKASWKWLWLPTLAALLVVESGCYPPPPSVAAQPSAVISAPPPEQPAYVASPYAPAYYVWDGNEYVGVSNGQYVYWTGGAWVIAPPIILGRFHGWERYHPDWHRRAFRYRREPFR
ncbi:MAG: hypothetical protein ACREIC_16480 [Limisphaerales bacterium]